MYTIYTWIYTFKSTHMKIGKRFLSYKVTNHTKSFPLIVLVQGLADEYRVVSLDVRLKLPRLSEPLAD